MMPFLFYPKKEIESIERNSTTLQMLKIWLPALGSWWL
jgi:hypothetical protein